MSIRRKKEYFDFVRKIYLDKNKNNIYNKQE